MKNFTGIDSPYEAPEDAELVLDTVSEAADALAERIEEELFTFEMLFVLDPMSMGRLLRDVDNEKLVDALKGLKDPDRAPVFGDVDHLQLGDLGHHGFMVFRPADDARHRPAPQHAGGRGRPRGE